MESLRDTVTLLACLTMVANVGVLAFIATSPRWGAFRDSVANPMLLVLLLTVVALLDFLFLLDDRRIRLFEIQQRFSEGDVVEALVAFTLVTTATVLGMVAAMRLPPPPDDLKLLEPDVRAAKWMQVITLLPALAATVVLIRALPAILQGTINRQLLFGANPLLLVALGTVIPGFAISLGVREHPPRGMLPMLLLVAVIILLTGSRGALFLLALVAIVALINAGNRIPAALYLPGIPLAVALLTGLRYVFRESWRYDSIGEFIAAKGGLLEIYFGGAEIGLADAFTAIYHDTERFARPPFESLLGILMYPVPRAIADFKPVSASATLTAQLSPRNWELTQSEILATGYGDLIAQFGLLGGVIIAAVLGFAWCRLVQHLTRAQRLTTGLLLPFALYCYYIAYRGAFFNLGSLLWPLMVTVLGYWALTTRPERA